MTAGVVIDDTYGGHKVADWVAGAPEKSFFTGLALKGKERIPILTYRCDRCYVLEHYAPPA